MLHLVKRYRELLLVAGLFLGPLLVYLAGTKAPGERNAVDRGVLTVTAPLQRAVVWTVNGVQDLWGEYVDLRRVRDENLALRRELLVLEARVARVAEVERENDRLRELVGFAETEPETRVVAGIIGVGSVPSLARTLRLDRGTGDGVAIGYPVLTPKGAVGRVVAAGPGWADVLILADPNSAVAALSSRSRARVTVRGTGALDEARVDHALRTDDLEEGDLLITSGTGGIFPKGIPIGRVAGVERKSYGLFQEARVIPAVDLARLEEVVVVILAAEGEGATAPPLAKGGQR